MRKNGEEFEGFVRTSAHKLGWECMKIPTGSKTFGGNKIIRQKSPFDFVMMKSGNAIFFDAKSISSANFTYSNLNQDQIYRLNRIQDQGFKAGYVIYYRAENKVYFYTSSYLSGLRKGSRVEKQAGLYLGPVNEIYFDSIIERYTIESCHTKKSEN